MGLGLVGVVVGFGVGLGLAGFGLVLVEGWFRVGLALVSVGLGHKKA